MFRSTFVLLPVAALVAALSLRATRTNVPAKQNAVESPLEITSTILELENRLDDAESHHRVDDVQGLIANDYWGITLGGGIITKRDVLAAVSGPQQASSQSTDREVRPMQNAAVYTALVLDQGTDAKTHEPYALATRVMDVWQKRGGTWKLVNDEATNITLHRAPSPQPSK